MTTHSDNCSPFPRELGIHVFQRGWLSSNSTLIRGSHQNALIDSGYHCHAAQIVELVGNVLGDAPLQLLLNTHLHSDHCGGNAALQRRYPDLQTAIPPGLSRAVAEWDTELLTYGPTGQECERFGFDRLLEPGDSLQLGDATWEIHGAKGHDPHSVVLFQRTHGILVSADALWENGFGVVFPELEGDDAFHEVAQTLDIIERLGPRVVIPGHGAVFTDVAAALDRARSRLDQFIEHPERHLRHALKVLLKFRLLAWRQIALDELERWATDTPYLNRHMPDPGSLTDTNRQWLYSLIGELERAGVAATVDGYLVDR